MKDAGVDAKISMVLGTPAFVKTAVIDIRKTLLNVNHQGINGAKTTNSTNMEMQNCTNLSKGCNPKSLLCSVKILFCNFWTRILLALNYKTLYFILFGDHWIYVGAAVNKHTMKYNSMIDHKVGEETKARLILLKN